MRLLRAQAKLLGTAGHGKCLLKVFERPKVVEYVKGDLFCRDGGQVGSVFSPHMESFMKLVELRNKESAALLLLRYSILRVAPRTRPLTRLIWGRYTVLTIVFGHCGCHGGGLSMRTNGGEDHEDESIRSSLGNHKTCRFWVKAPSQATKRDVVV